MVRFILLGGVALLAAQWALILIVDNKLEEALSLIIILIICFIMIWKKF